jgi:serine/threonine protein kinase/Flp pilus assembly protein TadD
MNLPIPTASQGRSAEHSLAELIEELSARMEAGEPIELQALLDAHPEHAAELRHLYPALQLLANFSRSGEANLPVDVPESMPALGGPLGDFRILREVGRGGMGVVYEAEQISLRRRVALKVLPFAATMDARQLQRFHNEAQAAACLHHTNIVPVFSVGCERGVHFYAMQYIDGHPLSELIRQMRQHEKKAPTVAKGEPTVVDPTPADAAASTPLPAAEITPLTAEGRRGRDYFRKVAELGVQAAEALDHAHQLGIVHRDIKPANLLLDGRGNVWVTDFGLAHMQHGEASLTLSGQAVGTPRYMSPEQASAKRVPIDHRTDVYSLGVTLYELLTLRPAFASEDRQELLREIALEDPTRPRRFERAIPAELEIIILKAMEKRPQDRYATAQELADDLERWLRTEPIHARCPSLLQRSAKWGRRHKPAVAASVVVLLMALLLAAYVGWMRHDQALRRAASEQVIQATLEESRDWQQQRRLPEAFSTARRADGLLAGADVNESLRQQVRARLADLELLERLENVRLETMPQPKEGSFDYAGADDRYGQILRDTEMGVEGFPAEEAAERIGRTTVTAELAAVLDHWAWVRQNSRGADDLSWKHFLRVARLADPDAWRTRLREARERRDFQALRALATSEEVWDLSPGSLYILGNALREDMRFRPQQEVFLREAQRRYPNDFWLNFQLYDFFSDMQPAQWEEAFHFAGVIVALQPRNASTHANLGFALGNKGRLDEAIAEYREAIRLKYDFATAHNNLAHALCNKGQLDDAIAECRAAIRIKKDFAPAHNNLGVALYGKGLLDEPIAEWREAVRIKKDYAMAHNNLGAGLRAKGQLDEAIAEWREAIRLKKELPEAHSNLGLALRHKGQLDEAIAECREAIRIKKDNAEAHDNLGAALHDKGQLDEAIAESREAIRIKKDYFKFHYNLGNSLHDKGQLDEAIAEYREAIRLNKDYAKPHTALALALRAKGQLDEAIAEYREAIRLNKDDAIPHVNLGNALYDKGQLDEAIAEYREAIRLNKDLTEAHCTLGLALVQKGQFQEAVEELRLGHKLGSRNPRWPYPSAQWVRNAERMAALDSKLSAVLEGKEKPADVAERLDFAQICQRHRNRHAAAVRFYSEAFDLQENLTGDRQSLHRYNAACSAALAGCGAGKDAPSEDTERADLRRRALEWLRDDLKAEGELLKKSELIQADAARKRLEHWLADPAFNGMRGPDALAKLPETEREGWRHLWADVAQMLAKTKGKAPMERKPDPK